MMQIIADNSAFSAYCMLVQGDEDFEKIVADGEEALTWVEEAAAGKAE